MKTLSREGIQRMVDGAGGGSASGGGISSSDLAGLATQMWVNQNYLSIEFFSSLFKAYAPAETTGDPDVEVTPNGGDTSTITNIKAMFGFWTEQYISALGQGSGGGGGGATALTDLVDVNPDMNPSAGDVLTYRNGKWTSEAPQGGGSTAWGDITNKPTTIAGYGITDAYTKTEADAKFLTSSSFSAFTASDLNISATIGTTTRTVQAPTIAYLGTNVEAASSETTPSSIFAGTKFGASSGFYMTGVYPNVASPADIPCNYGNILNILGGGGGQLLAEWCNTYKTGHLYYRSHRDYLATGGWTPWEKIAFTTDNVASATYATSAGSATNADTVDGFHASGLLQEMTYNSGVLGIKIGNTTMSAEMYKVHHRNGSNGGTNGWLKMVTIDVSQVSYKNQPFRFFITQRNKKGALLTLLLNNGTPSAETNPHDYVIVAFSYQGEITKAIVTTDSANVFSIWIQKSESWDNVAMSLINYDIVYMSGAIVSYQDGFQTSDPSGTEAVMDTLTWSQIANKPTTLSGYGITDAYTKTETDNKFLTIAFFRSLFKAYTSANAEVVPNSGDTSTIASIKAMFGFWTEQYISALGQNSSGGGGGGATALDDLTDVEFSGTPSDGQVLKYNGTTHKWYNGTDEGLTSLPWSSITGKPTTLSGYGITDAYTKTEADGRYLKLSGGSMLNTNVVTNMNADLLDGLNGADYLSRHNIDNDYYTTPGQKIITVTTGSRIVSEAQYGSLIQWGNSNKTPGTDDSSTWYNQLIGLTNDRLYFRTRTNGGDWTTAKKIAFISDFSSWALASTKPSYSFSELTSHPTTLSGYGITDAYISGGTIYLGSNSITPLTSFTETDPTVPAWAKASTKPSYAFSEITGSVAFSQLPTMYWADVAVSNSSNNNTSPQFGNLRLRPGSDNYGSYLRFGDGDYAYIAELSDDQLTYRAGSHTFNVSSSEAVQINSSGLRIGGSSGVVLSWDSTNNALKVQKADGTAANLYATGGVSALGLSGGSSGSIGTLTVTSRLNIGNTDCNLQQDSGGDFHINCNNYLYLGSSLSYIDSDGWMTATGLRAKVDNSTYFLATEDGIDFFSSAAGYHPIRIYYNGSWRTLNMQAAINAGLFS